MRKSEVLVAILAAGASRRLGRPKQLVVINGEPLIHRQCRVALAAAIGPAIAILGCHAEACAGEIADLPVEVSINAAWKEGMAASIRHAVRAAIERQALALLILHGDQFRITPDDLRALHSAWSNAPCAAYISRRGSYTGPPTILPASLFEQSLTLHGDCGARAMLNNANAIDLIEVEVPNARFDLDDAQQLAMLGGASQPMLRA